MNKHKSNILNMINRFQHTIGNYFIQAIISMIVISSLSACGEASINRVSAHNAEETPSQSTLIPTITPQPEIIKSITVSYKASALGGGYIKGMVKQILEGDSAETAQVTAVPYLGYKFLQWSDGNTNPKRTDVVTEDTDFTAIYAYDFLELPVLSITTETGEDVTFKTDYINGTISIQNAGQYNTEGMEFEIRGRGNNSWSYDKKSYKVKFEEKINLFGIADGEGKKWVLLANMCDRSLLRNKISFDFMRNLSGIGFAPASMSVEVYLNGKYRGVYLLAEEINVSKDRVNISEDNLDTDVMISYLVEMTNYADKVTCDAAGRSFQIHSNLAEKGVLRNQQINYIRNDLENCYAAVADGDREQIEQLIDMDSLIDTYLAEETIKNLDAGWDSFYLYKEAGEKLCFGPLWDFDLAMGNADLGSEYYTGLYVAENITFQSNQWYYTMMEYEWFRELVKERWDELKSVWSALPDDIRSEAAKGIKAYNRNFDRWQIFGQQMNRDTELIISLMTYQEQYEYLADWMQNRVSWMDEFIHTPEYLDGENGNVIDSGTFEDEESLEQE